MVGSPPEEVFVECTDDQSLAQIGIRSGDFFQVTEVGYDDNYPSDFIVCLWPLVYSIARILKIPTGEQEAKQPPPAAVEMQDVKPQDSQADLINLDRAETATSLE